MSQKSDQAVCGAGWASDDGGDDLTCTKPPGRHVVHEDAKRGRSFVHVPPGAVSFRRKKQKG
jgi:hypothetical protein